MNFNLNLLKEKKILLVSKHWKIPSINNLIEITNISNDISGLSNQNFNSNNYK